MLRYIGTKVINAMPMTLGQYNELRQCSDDSETEGYLVEYPDSKPNVPGFKGYISWSPKDVFEAAYLRTDFLTFSQGIELLRLGYRIARHGWNGKNMFLFLVPGSTFEVNRPPLLGIYPAGTVINYQSHIDMKTAQDTVVPWLASQDDILALDWYIVE